MPYQQHNKNFKISTKTTNIYKEKKCSQKNLQNQQIYTKKNKIFTKKGKSVYPAPQTKMTHCPQCVQKYNTRGMAQVRQT
jgi:hypothetical protein